MVPHSVFSANLLKLTALSEDTHYLHHWFLWTHSVFILRTGLWRPAFERCALKHPPASLSADITDWVDTTLIARIKLTGHRGKGEVGRDTEKPVQRKSPRLQCCLVSQMSPDVSGGPWCSPHWSSSSWQVLKGGSFCLCLFLHFILSLFSLSSLVHVTEQKASHTLSIDSTMKWQLPSPKCQ